MNSRYDVETLLKQYNPLIKAVYSKFRGYYKTQFEQEDLLSQVNQEFIQLVNEYDPRRGVDIPCYLKKMLNLRVYHYVTKTLDLKNHESVSDSFEDYKEISKNVEDTDAFSAYEKADALQSIDPDLPMGTKQQKLLVDILMKEKTPQQIADEEGVDVKVVRLRLHFLCEKLENHSKELAEAADWRNGRTPTEMIDYDDN